MTELETRIASLVEPILEPLGLELYDLEHRGGTLRVLVDRADGVDLDEITTATRAISRALDEDDPLGGRYTLEVSSPGLERPLRRPEHWQAAVGSDVTIKRVGGVEGDRRITGRLVEVDDDGATIDVSPDATRLRVPYTEVDKARMVFDWEPTPRPGGGGRAKGTSKRVTTT